jgi:hypothetical protein
VILSNVTEAVIMARWLTTIRLRRTFGQIIAVTIVVASVLVGRPVTDEAILWGRHRHDWFSILPWFGSDYRRSYRIAQRRLMRRVIVILDLIILIGGGVD